MQFIGIFILFASLLHQNALGIDLTRILGNVQPHYGDPSINSTTEEHLITGSDGGSSLDSNSTEFQNGSISEAVSNATLTEVDQTNSTLDTRQATVGSTDQVASSSRVMSTSSNESHSSSSLKGVESTSTGISSSSTSEADEEPEEVARGKPTIAVIVMNATSPEPETVYQKALHLINDTYTLSILLPIAAGVVFATSILMTIAVCRCMRRACRRRRLRSKALPDSVKNLRPSDRARLLAESSDDEF